MIRKGYEEKLKLLHEKLTMMGKNCETAIDFALKSLEQGSEEYVGKAKEIDSQIDDLEKEIGDLCVKLILREQPVAEDLRRVIAAQKIIVDMERVGDQAFDIADLTRFINDKNLLKLSHLKKMAKESSFMLKEAIESYITLDLKRAEKVIEYDDIVDNLFVETRKELAEIIYKDKSKADILIDLLLICKHLEKIGDHATNIALEVKYVLFGN